MRRFLRLACACALGAAGLVRAEAQITINASVNSDRIAPGEQFTLTISVSGSGSDLPHPRLPALGDFEVYSAGNTQSLSIVNGAARSNIEYIYLLSPRFTGRKTIGPVSVVYRGKEYRTPPIQVDVTGDASQSPRASRGARRMAPNPGTGAGPNQGGPDVFLDASIDKPRPYVNEQVTLSVRFFTAVNLLGNPQYSPPELSGFISEDLPPERHGERVVNGRRYYFSEIKTALFPLRPGRASIGPAKVGCQVESQAAWDPFSPDFFNKFFSQAGGGVPKVLQSRPITVEARPLPAQGKPSDFSGAVGRFRLAASLDRSSARVGDAVTLAVKVEGEGNIKSIAAPTLPPLPSFRSYDTVSSFNTSKTGDVVGGAAVFKTLIVPRAPGNLEVPPVTFSYFDPKSGSYRTLRTTALPLKVAPAPAGEASKASPSPETAEAPELTAVSNDIRYLKTAPVESWATKALGAVSRGGSTHAIPLFLLILAFSWAKYSDFKAQNPSVERARRAWRAAQARLKAASEQTDPARVPSVLYETMRRYLADKLHEPPASLTLQRTLDLLNERWKDGTKPELVEGIRALWQDLERQSFAPSPGGRDSDETTMTIEALRNLLQSIERTPFK